MKTSLEFSHKNETLSAVIVRTYLDIKDRAKDAFDQDGIEGEVKVRELYDRVKGPSQPGYPQYYAIFETYIDSGSVDYYYFAVPTYAEIDSTSPGVTETIEFTLPAIWASYLINDDPSGLEQSDIDQCDRDTAGMGHCVGVSNYSWFESYKGLGSEVAKYMFYPVIAVNE